MAEELLAALQVRLDELVVELEGLAGQLIVPEAVWAAEQVPLRQLIEQSEASMCVMTAGSALITAGRHLRLARGFPVSEEGGAG